MFRRRRRDEPATTDGDFVLEQQELATEEPAAAAPAALMGPWDAADAPPDEVARLDLGALQVPVYKDIEIRVEVGAESEVVAATLVYDAGSLQLNAFAAPRREGLWAEVRAEIAASIGQAGGSSEEAAGPFGPELHAQVPNDPSGQGVQPARFLGVDGPRWFLRGVITGPAATDPAPAARLEDAFRQTVVVRGGEAMAPRDALPLALPKEALEAAVPEAGLDPFQRGPEIKEIQ